MVACWRENADGSNLGTMVLLVLVTPGEVVLMRTLLTITAALEAGTGVALLIAPSALALILLGAPLDSSAGLVIGRVLGSALLAIGMACGLARDDARSRAAAGMVAAMLLYNIAVVALLVHARIGLKMSGIGSWPGAMLHSGLAVWCIVCLRAVRRDTREPSEVRRVLP